MTAYVKAAPGELPEIRDFINMVFSMHRKPHDFSAVQPKLYGAGRETERFHYLAKEDGRIKAVVCALPFTLIHRDEILHCASIGSVSVHPYSRQKGYMKELMNWAQRDLVNQNISLSVLAGRRQRYQYFGYELSGQKIEFKLNPDNFRHNIHRFTDIVLNIVPVDSQNQELISQCLQLFQNQCLHSDRKTDDFFQICSTLECSLYAVFHGNHLSGYFCSNNNRIYELVLEREELLFSCLRHVTETLHWDSLTLDVPSWQSQRIQLLSSFCERFFISQEDNFCIMNYRKVISFFLNIKATEQPLSDGCIRIKPEGGPPLEITVHHNNVSIKDISQCQSPCFDISRQEAANFLFSPGAFLPSALPPLLSTVNWFPLPLSLSSMDKC